MIGTVVLSGDHETKSACILLIIVNLNVLDRDWNFQLAVQAPNSVIKILHRLIGHSHDGHLQRQLFLNIALIDQQVDVVVRVLIKKHVLREGLDLAAELVDLGVRDKGFQLLVVDAV